MFAEEDTQRADGLTNDVEGDIRTASAAWWRADWPRVERLLTSNETPRGTGWRLAARSEFTSADTLEAELKGAELAAGFPEWLAGRVAHRRGDVERALEHWQHAARLEVAPTDVRCAAALDAATALLHRDGPTDSSVAAARLGEARAWVREAARRRFEFLVADARSASGDHEGGRTAAEKGIADARVSGDRGALAVGFGVLSRICSRSDEPEVATTATEQRLQVWEDIALGLAPAARESFWAVVRPEGKGNLRSKKAPPPEPARDRTLRILELTKRLASEHDLDRLLERITDAAVEIARAERGFVLLPNTEGVLVPRLIRSSASPADPSVAFSRSIAEAVWIDGEPIVSVNAQGDGRLSEYLSVHKLMLRSVACLPIRGREGTLGVLYLEHRMRKGRFREEDLGLLMAFADLAAIALSNARLIERLGERERALQKARDAAEAARQEMERVLVARTDELMDAQVELERSRGDLKGGYERFGIIGRSPAMRKVFAVLDRVRGTDVPVVIHGESGTGKELIARAIHYTGTRAKAPFVAVNCAAIPDALLESELFGHVRGAFTGADRTRAGLLARAHGGTLFLDEVGDMPAKMQVDLLRVLQDGIVRPIGGDTEDEQAVDVRIISASNRALPELVKSGEFREDLFYRLQVVGVDLPPLRHRQGDVPVLVDHLLRRIAEKEGVARKRLSRAALERLSDHPMPGNVRQLEHVLLNAYVMTEGGTIGEEDLALPGAPTLERSEPRPEVVAQSLGDFKSGEKQRILEALETSGWNRAKAARALGMPRRTFYRRLKEHDILQ